MNNEKLLVIKTKLETDHIIYFRLYNALYRIHYTNKSYYIKQKGMSISYKYKTLKELFTNYIIYGNTLEENIKNIKIY